MLAKLTGFLLLGFIRLLTGAQARWYGCPPKAEQRIYFANHQSHADLVMIWAALPHELRSITRPIAAKDYWTKSNFRRWITTEVLPTIRKHGAYMSPAVIEQTLTDPDFIIRLATDLKAERARNAELAAESERRRARLTLVVPKADAFDLWLSTNINFAVGTVAKALCAAGADSGRTKLFDYMAELGWIFKSGRQWEPYQSQINNGRLAVKLGSQLNTRTGEQFQTVTVRITPKGATALATRYGVMPETVADLLAADPEAGAA